MTCMTRYWNQVGTTHILNSTHIISTHIINTYYQHILSTHIINTYYQHIYYQHIPGGDQHLLPRPRVQQLAQSAKPRSQKTGIHCLCHDYHDDDKLGISKTIQTCWQSRSCMGETDIWWNIDESSFCLWNKHLHNLVTTLWWHTHISFAFKMFLKQTFADLGDHSCPWWKSLPHSWDRLYPQYQGLILTNTCQHQHQHWFLANRAQFS